MRALLVPFREGVKQNAARLDDAPNRRHIDQEPNNRWDRLAGACEEAVGRAAG